MPPPVTNNVTLAQPQTPPADVDVDSLTLTMYGSTITAEWDHVSGAASYHVTLKAQGAPGEPVDLDTAWPAFDGNGDPINRKSGDETKMSLTIADAAASAGHESGTYWFGLRAKNAAGPSAWRAKPVSPSAVPPPTPAPTPAPTPPADVDETSLSLTMYGGAITAEWDHAPGATSYHLTLKAQGAPGAPVDVNTAWPAFDGDGNAVNRKSGDAAKMSFTIADAPATAGHESGVYWFGLRAKNAAGPSAWKAKPVLPALLTPPGAPTRLTATAGDGGVTLSWDDPSDASITGYEYNVNHNATSTGNFTGWSAWQSIANSGADSTSHTLTGLTNGREYRYHLRAVNAAGTGSAAPNAHPWFVSATPTAPPAAPTNLSVTPLETYTNGGLDLDIDWDAVDGATGYDIRARSEGSSDWHDAATGVTANSYRYLPATEIAAVAVRAVNAGGQSAWTELSRSQPPLGNSSQGIGALGGLQSAGAQAQSAGIQAESGPPPAPATVRLTRDNWLRDEKLHVQFTNVPGITHYALYCADYGGWNASDWWFCAPGDIYYRQGDPWLRTTVTDGRISGVDLRYSAPYIVAVAVYNGQWSPYAFSNDAYPAFAPWPMPDATRASGSITVTWTPHRWAQGYEIECGEYKPGGATDFTVCADVENQTLVDGKVSHTITSWTVDGTTYTIDDTKKYDIIVRTTNAAGKSTFQLLRLIYPANSLTLGSIGATSATLNFANHTGAWSLKRTAPTGDNTCITGESDFSHALSGLTAGATYTYTAYWVAGCREWHDVASVTFTTDGLEISNLDKAVHSIPCWADHNSQCAVGFTTGSAAGGYTLSSFTARFGDREWPVGNVVVTLHASTTTNYGDNKRPADAALATLGGDNPHTAGDYTYTCTPGESNDCTLKPDTTYFVQVGSDGGDGAKGFKWLTTLDNGETLRPSGNGWTLADGTDSRQNAAWIAEYGDTGLMKLSAMVIPTLTAGDLTATSATLTLGDFTRNWWLKRTQPSDGSCTPGEADYSHALSNLTAGTTYTYKAYSDSSCASAYELAERTFSTAVTVSNLSETDSGDSPTQINWVGGGTIRMSLANSFTTGAHSGGYTLQSVTVDFKATVGSPGDLTVQINATSGSTPGGTVIATLSGSNPTTAGQYTFTCSGSCSLSADSTYWVVMYSASGNPDTDLYELVWITSDSETNDPSGAGWSIGNVAYEASGTMNPGWNSLNTVYPDATADSFRFKVTAVPK